MRTHVYACVVYTCTHINGKSLLTVNFGPYTEAAIVAWVARDLMFSLVVFVLPDRLLGTAPSAGGQTT